MKCTKKQIITVAFRYETDHGLQRHIYYDFTVQGSWKNVVLSLKWILVYSLQSHQHPSISHNKGTTVHLKERKAGDFSLNIPRGGRSRISSPSCAVKKVSGSLDNRIPQSSGGVGGQTVAAASTLHGDDEQIQTRETLLSFTTNQSDLQFLLHTFNHDQTCS